MIFAARWFTIGFACAIVLHLLFHPPMLVTGLVAVLCGFVIGAVSMAFGDWLDDRFDDPQSEAWKENK